MKTIHYALVAGLAGALALSTATPSDAQSRRGKAVHSDRVAAQSYGNPVRAGAGFAGRTVGAGVGLAAGAIGAGVGLATGVAGAALSPFTGGVNYGYAPGYGYGAGPYGAYASAGPVDRGGPGAAYAAQPAAGGCWISTDLNRGYGYVGACGTRRADYGVAAITGQPGTQGTVLPYPIY